MLLAAMTGMARAVPLRTGYRIADGLSAIHHAVSPKRRAAVIENLGILGVTDATGTAPSVFRHYGRTMFEFLRGPSLPDVPVRIEGWAHIEAARARGRGVILAGSHTGNWTAAGSAISDRGVRMHAVAAIQLNERWTPALRERQRAAGVRILPPSVSSWRSLPKALAANDAVGLFVDGDVFTGGVSVDVCGRSVRVPAGPAKLAARTGAALVPTWALRDPDGALRVVFGPEVPLATPEGSTPGHPASPDVIRETTHNVVQAVFEGIRRHPEQWVIFRRFFVPESAPPKRGAPAAAASLPSAGGVA